MVDEWKECIGFDRSDIAHKNTLLECLFPVQKQAYLNRKLKEKAIIGPSIL